MNNDQDLDLRVGRWLDGREVPGSAERVSDRILTTLATTRQERRPILRRGPIARPPLRLLAVAAALIVVGGLAAVLGVGERPALVFVPSPTPSQAPIVTPNPYPQLVRQIDLSTDTWQVLGTPSRVWVQTGDFGVTGVDPSTGEASAQIDGATWMFLEGADLWVQKGAEETLVRVDPETGRELERFESIPGFNIAKDGDTIWGCCEDGDAVRVDMTSGEVLASVEVPAEPKQIVLAADAVWVACDAGNALVRIDPDTAEITDTIDVGFGAVELEQGFDSLWVRNRQQELVRIDPETAEVIATIAGFASSPSLGLSFGGGYVWASNPNGISAVDPDTNELAFRIPLPVATFMDTYWLDDSLWVSTAAGGLLLQVDAARP